MALGAGPGDILREVVGRTARIAAWGVGLGTAASLGAGRLLAGSLYGIGPADPATFAAVALGLMGVSLLASWGPCRRAALVDPIDSLRAE
jgi:ABC-type antimicrobial peptide transport system permease subunit